MSRKTTHTYTVFNAADATVAQTGAETSVLGVDKASYHVKFSTNNTGTFNVQGRNSDSDTWFNVNFGVSLAVTADNEASLNMFEVPYKYLRLIWTPSSGAGTITAILTIKAVGS